MEQAYDLDFKIKSETKCNFKLDIRLRGSVGYLSGSSLYPRYSTDSIIVLCMVLTGVSG